MKGLQQSRPKINEENVYKFSKCPCPGNSAYSRKSDRTPLGELQDSASKKSYLTVDYGQQRKGSCRSISPTPPVKPVLTKLPDTITIRSSLKSEYQKQLPKVVPVRARSSSCRCAGNRPSTSETAKPDGVRKSLFSYKDENSNDDVFLAPTATKTNTQSKTSPLGLSQITLSSTQTSRNNRYFYDSQPHVQVPQKRGHSSSDVNTCRTSSINKAKSTENVSESFSTLNSISSTHSQVYSSTKLSSKSIQSSPYISPNVLASRQKLSSFPSISSSSARLAPKIQQMHGTQNATSHTKVNQTTCYYKTLPSQNFQTLPTSLESSNLNSISSTLRETKGLQHYQNSVASYEGCRSTGSTTKTDQTSRRFATLPSQYFVTLTQDTLKTTFDHSNLDTMASALSKVNGVRDTSIFDGEGTSFVDGKRFFQDIDHGKCSTIKTIPVYSPLNIDVPLRRSNSVCETQKARVPAIKNTLRRKSSITKQIVYPLLYSPEYLQDIISYSNKHITNLLLKSEWIEAYMDRRYRSFTLNWLFQITEWIFPNRDHVYYMAVRIFDFTVIKLRLRKSMYQLVAIVAFWISLKFLDDTVVFKIPKIYALCKGQYSKEQILLMERTILKTLDFCMNMAHPLDFLFNYLKSVCLENNELLIYSSQFVMECATLFENYPLARPSFIAASALYLAYKTIMNSNDVYINFIWFERTKVQHYAENVLALNVKYAIMENYEPVNKYLTVEKMQVAKKFL